MKNKTIPIEHYTHKKKSFKHTFLFPYPSLSNRNNDFKIFFLIVLQHFIDGIY